jgi:hypothetical protein
VPYADATAAGRPHKGEAILEDVTRQLLDFRPTRILVSHPEDRHGDHQAGALFLLAARLDSAGRLPEMQVLAYPTHSAEWPRPRGDHPDFWMPVPPELSGSLFPWRSLELSAAEVRIKGEALRLHESQMLTIGRELRSLVRRNELFAAVAAAPLPRADAPRPEAAGRFDCRDAGDALAADIPLPAFAPQGGGVSVCAFGFRGGRPFGEMPKFRAVWTPAGLRAYDQETALPADAAGASRSGDRLTLRIPWAALGDPENLFVEVRGEGAGEDARQSGWLIFRRGR